MQQSNLVEILREIRVKVHGDVEDSVLQQLDEAILKLEEESHKRPNLIDNQVYLELLSKGIGVIPVFVEFMKFFRDQC